MTIKERIEAFVLNQGNQVGAGAELAAILNDIVDSIPGAYTLPPATAETLGGVKVGSGLSVTELGVLSASGGGSQPLIVEGTTSGAAENIFTPASGQPSFNQALNAFRSGIPVILKYSYLNVPVESVIMTYRIDEGGYGIALESFYSDGSDSSAIITIEWPES